MVNWQNQVKKILRNSGKSAQHSLGSSMSCLKYLAIAALVAPGAAHALQIDPFTDASSVSASGTTSNSEVTDPLSISGFKRTNSVTSLYGSNPSRSVINPSGLDGWGINHGFQAKAESTLAYDLGGENLSGFNAFSFGTVAEIGGIQGAYWKLAATIATGNGNGAAEVTVAFLGNPNFTPDFTFGDEVIVSFSEFSGVDFSDVDSLSLTATEVDGAGGGLGLRGGISAVPVPVPGALPLLGLCVVGYAVGARRKKALQAA